MIFHSYVSLPEGIKGDFHCHVWWPECRFEHGESLHMLAIWCLFGHQMTCNPDTRCICLCQVSIQLVISYNFSFLYIYIILYRIHIHYIYIYIRIHIVIYFCKCNLAMCRKLLFEKTQKLIIIHTLEFRTSSWCHQCWEIAFRAYSDGHGY